jgi:hypothetical protein
VLSLGKVSARKNDALYTFCTINNAGKAMSPTIQTPRSNHDFRSRVWLGIGVLYFGGTLCLVLYTLMTSRGAA